ncbi:DNA polymerase II [Aliikangiella sp. IMCC44632]
MSNEILKGFIFSRTSQDVNGKAVIRLWVKTDDAAVELVVENESPVFFLLRADLPKAKTLLKGANIRYVSRLLTMNTFQNKPVAALYFTALADFYNARKQLQQNQITLYESNVRLEERFLMERFIRGSISFQGKSVGTHSYVVNKIKPAHFKPNLKLVSLDIECSGRGELFSIGLTSEQKQCVLMIGKAQDYPDALATIKWVENEKDLLNTLIKTINQLDPDVIIGWNVINFDFRLLIQRAQKHQLKLALGRDHSEVKWRVNSQDSQQGFVSIHGRVVIDGIAALRGATYSFPSFSLQSVAEILLGESKLIENPHDRLAQIEHDFKHNKTKLAAYNLKDCQLVEAIFNKTKILDFLIYRCDLTGLELDRVGGSVAAFNNLYLPKLHRKGYVSPNLPNGGGLASPGGFVMDSLPGLYTNVLLLDFKSLYPSIIRTFKIDPLGLVKGLQQPSQAIPGFKDASFSYDEHILPGIIETIWQQRDAAKKAQDPIKSQALKILMNSFYGVLGSGGCPFYDTRLASSITLRGHWIMQKTAAWITQMGYQVIYGDTDSTFVYIQNKFSNDELFKLGNQLCETLNNRWQQELKQTFNLHSYLEMEFECVFSQFMMPTIRGSEKGSKKRYAGLKLTHDNQHELVFKGLESVRTDWTQMAKDFQQSLYLIIFSGSDPSELITSTIAQTIAGLNDNRLVYRKRLRRRLDDYTKNVPPHVKAARLADQINLAKGRAPQYQNKGWIEYVITLEGPQPVEYRQAPIDYQHYIDKQIQPIAEAALMFTEYSFEQITSQQLGLF